MRLTPHLSQYFESRLQRPLILLSAESNRAHSSGESYDVLSSPVVHLHRV